MCLQQKPPKTHFRNGIREFYYRCNGVHSPSVYAKTGRCQAKAVRGDHLEQQVWSDVESFVRNPEPVLQQLQSRLQSDAQGSEQIRTQVKRLEGLLAEKATERSRVIGLYRRGRLTETDLDAQMDEISKEETSLEIQVAELSAKIAGADTIGATINSAQALLDRLRERLDEPISWELKRRLIEVLVAGIRVDTVESCGVKESRITVTYRFSQPDQPMPVVLPQAYSAGSVVRIPVQPQTVGDHIRKRRLGLKMLQRDVAEQLGVDKTSVFNWEANTSTPGNPVYARHHQVPRLQSAAGVERLGPSGWSGNEQVWAYRRRTALYALASTPARWRRWERGERQPAGEMLNRVTRFLDDGDFSAPVACSMISVSSTASSSTIWTSS